MSKPKVPPVGDCPAPMAMGRFFSFLLSYGFFSFLILLTDFVRKGKRPSQRGDAQSQKTERRLGFSNNRAPAVVRYLTSFDMLFDNVHWLTLVTLIFQETTAPFSQ